MHLRVRTARVKNFQSRRVTCLLPSITSRKPRFVTRSSEKFEKLFGWGVRWAGHVGSYPRTLDTPQQSSFFKSSAPNAAVALVFQCSAGNAATAVSFLKLTLETQWECSFFKSNVGNTVGVLGFRKEHWKRHSRVRFSKPALETPQECQFFETNARNPLGSVRFSKAVLKRP